MSSTFDNPFIIIFFRAILLFHSSPFSCLDERKYKNRNNQKSSKTNKIDSMMLFHAYSSSYCALWKICILWRNKVVSKWDNSWPTIKMNWESQCSILEKNGCNYPVYNPFFLLYCWEFKKLWKKQYIAIMFSIPNNSEGKIVWNQKKHSEYLQKSQSLQQQKEIHKLNTD